MSEMLWLWQCVPIIPSDNWNVRGREGVCWAVRSTQSTIDTIRATMGPVVGALLTSQAVIQSVQSDDRCGAGKLIMIGIKASLSTIIHNTSSVYLFKYLYFVHYVTNYVLFTKLLLVSGLWTPGKPFPLLVSRSSFLVLLSSQSPWISFS